MIYVEFPEGHEYKGSYLVLQIGKGSLFFGCTAQSGKNFVHVDKSEKVVFRNGEWVVQVAENSYLNPSNMTLTVITSDLRPFRIIP